MSASDRLIPTETNPSSLEDMAQKSLPPTPAVATTKENPPATQGDQKQDSSDHRQPPPQPGREKKSGADDKREWMERFQPPKDANPLDLGKQKGDRWAKDPVTGQDILIRDPKFEGKHAKKIWSCDSKASL